MLHLTGSLKVNKFQAMAGFGVFLFVCFFLLFFFFALFLHLCLFCVCGGQRTTCYLPFSLSSMPVGAGESNSGLKARTLTHLATLAPPGYGFRWKRSKFLGLPFLSRKSGIISLAQNNDSGLQINYERRVPFPLEVGTRAPSHKTPRRSKILERYVQTG